MAKQFAAEIRVWATVRLEAESEGEALQKIAALAGEEIGVDGDLGDGLDLSPVATVCHDLASPSELANLSIWEE